MKTATTPRIPASERGFAGFVKAKHEREHDPTAVLIVEHIIGTRYEYDRQIQQKQTDCKFEQEQAITHVPSKVLFEIFLPSETT